MRLLTTISEAYQRVSMHGVRLSLLREQAGAAGLDLVEVPIPADPSTHSYEERMGAALSRAAAEGVAHIAFGDLVLEDVRAYREAMLARIGFHALFPLWGSCRPTLARRFIGEGFRAILSCVDTEQIEARFGGRDFDERLLVELPASADPCGENGEFHTFVHAGPIFSRPIPVRRGACILREERFLYCDLLGVEDE